MSIQLSKNLTLSEVTKSTTAIKYGIDNTPSAEHIENLRYVAETIFQPLREHFGKPIMVSSGYRSIALCKKVGSSASSQHCFDDKTDILTTNGWKKYIELKPDEIVYSYNTTTKLIEPIQINSLVVRQHEGIMYCAQTKQIDYCVTDKHRMFTKPATDCSKEFRFETADSIVGKRRLHITSGKKLKEDAPTIDINLLRLCFATIADGCVYTKKGCKKPFVRFVLKKHRDITELEDILAVLKMPYNKRYCANRHRQNQYGVYEYTIESTNAIPIIEIIGKKKEIPLWVLKLSSEELKQLIITYAKFDGSIDLREGNTGITIFSIHSANMEIMQAMAVLAGYRCIKKDFTNMQTTFGIMEKFYNLYLSDHTKARVNEENTFEMPYKGVVWCVSNKNETVIVRRNGKVYVCGNCKGEALDLDADTFGGLTNLDIFHYILNNLPFDQLIAEGCHTGKIEWVHVSATKRQMRKQALIMHVKDGKPVYVPYTENELKKWLKNQ